MTDKEKDPQAPGQREGADGRQSSPEPDATDSAAASGHQQSGSRDDADFVTNIQVEAYRLVRERMTLVRLKPNSKVPISEKGWQNSAPKPAQFEPDDNIGVQLGAKSDNLVDIDLDIPQARSLAGLPVFFGDLPAFRRRSLDVSEPGHRLVICRDAPDRVIQFHLTRAAEKEAIKSLGLAKAVILELRAGGCYTAFPPSKIEGDPLVWNSYLANGQVPETSWTELRAKAGLLAFAAFASTCYPAKGDRDNFCFHLAGALIHAGVPPVTADDIVVEVARLNGDDWSQRRGKAFAAAAKREAGEPVTGLPEFLRHIGMEACEKRIREWLQRPEANADTRLPADAILVGRPDIHMFLDELQDAAAAKMPDTLFRRAGSLVRLRALEKKIEEDGVIRHPGVTEIATVDSPWLRVALSRAGVTFYRRSKEKMLQVEPPKEVSLMLATAEESRFDRLRGVSMTPTLARSEPGYDVKSGLYLAFPEGMFPAPLEPTPENAKAALARLSAPLRKFPFKGPGSKSVVLSMFLSGVCRGELRTCPLHGVSAPTAGTGKTKLIDMAGILITGTKPSHATHTPSSEEMEKRLVSILRCGDQVINLDNAIAPLEGEFLASMLTSEVLQARILGESERVQLDTRTLVLATGNNLRLRGDMVRRAIICRIDAKTEQPDRRVFEFEPVAEIQQSRSQLVVDALTVLRAYINAGRPLPLHHRPLGSFDDWELVRGALIWLGQDDPVLTQAAARDDDDDREMLGDVLSALFRRFGNAEFRTRELENGISDTVRQEIQMHLRNGEWNLKGASMMLSKLRDRPWNGLALEGSKDTTDTRVWRVIGVPGVIVDAPIDTPPF